MTLNLDALNTAITSVNDALWTYLLIGALIICGLYFTIRTRFVQFTLLAYLSISASSFHSAIYTPSPPSICLPILPLSHPFLPLSILPLFHPPSIYSFNHLFEPPVKSLEKN